MELFQGALDGTFVSVHVTNEERARYRTRKGNLIMNVLSNHPKAGGLWRTPFPYLDKLDHVFGIDRANGMASELPEDSIKNLEEIVNLDNDKSDDDSVPQPPNAKKIKKEKTPKFGEKKKSPQIIYLTSNNMATEFIGFMKGMSSHLETIANAMSSTQNRETEVAPQKKLLSEIASFPGMTKAEAIRAACLFTSNPSQMDVFFSSPDDDWKKEVVLDLLYRNDKPLDHDDYAQLDEIQSKVELLLSLLLSDDAKKGEKIVKSKCSNDQILKKKDDEADEQGNASKGRG
ncbi:hypothetical protein AgCh_021137 [Apium graveolens]